MATAAEISALYNKYLGRDPLQSGIDAWIATGQNIEQIEQGIANSPEAAVYETYQATVGRKPTMEEREFYVNVNPAPIEIVEQVLSGTQEAQEFQTQQQLDETDMLADTTADDTTVDDVADDTPAAATKDTYTVITSNAKGDASSPFGGTAESNQTAQLVEMTEQELRQEFEDSGQLQQQFGSFDNYMGYINDSQEWVQSADWMLANPNYRPSDIESAVIEGEDLAFKPGQKEKVTEKISQDISNARQSGYQQWMNEGADILQKWGIQDTIYNDDGDQFKWTGSGYQKTIKVDDHASFADYATALTKSAVAGLLTGAVVGPALGTSTLGKAGTAGISNVAGQLATTGKVDPLAAVASGITAGINPGGMLAENFGQATKIGTNIVPSNVVGGFVQGATNELISSAITEGKLDLEGALVSGLIDAGVNAASDLLSDASNNSIESEMDRIQKDRAVKGLPELTEEQLYAAALTNANVGKSDLGGLVGEGGLLPFIEPVSTEGLNKLLGGGAFSQVDVFIGPDGKEYTDLEILEGAAGEGVSPADIYYGEVPGWTSGVITQQNTILGDAFDFAKENIPGVSQVTGAVSDLLDAAAAVEFKNTYGATPEEFLEAGVSIEEIQRMIAYGPLDETYNFAVNPRGDSQMVGTLSGIPGLYSTGANNPFLDYAEAIGDSASTIGGVDALQDALTITNLQDDAATAAANAAASSVAIVNLSGTETAVSSTTVLPGTNTTIADAILGGFIDGVLIDTQNNNSTVSSGGETVTQTLDAGVADTISNVINTTNNQVATTTDVNAGRSSFDDFETTVNNTTTLATTDTDVNAGRLSFDDFGFTDTTLDNNTDLVNDVNAGRLSFDDFSNTSDTTVNNNTTLTNNAVNNANISDTVVNKNTILPSNLETVVPPTTVLPSVSSDSGGGGGGGGGGVAAGGMLGGKGPVPFDIREIGITAQPTLQKRQQFPITESLLGMLTGNGNRLA